MIDRSARWGGNDGAGSEDHDHEPCICTPEDCLERCEAPGCRGYIDALNEAAGVRVATYDPDNCTAVRATYALLSATPTNIRKMTR